MKVIIKKKFPKTGFKLQLVEMKPKLYDYMVKNRGSLRTDPELCGTNIYDFKKVSGKSLRRKFGGDLSELWWPKGSTRSFGDSVWDWSHLEKGEKQKGIQNNETSDEFGKCKKSRRKSLRRKSLRRKSSRRKSSRRKSSPKKKSQKRRSKNRNI